MKRACYSVYVNPGIPYLGLAESERGTRSCSGGLRGTPLVTICCATLDGPATQSGDKIKTNYNFITMTNFQSKFRSVIAAFLTLVVFAAIIVGVFLDLDHAIKEGNQAQLQNRLILLTGESKFTLVPVAKRTRQIASALWQQRPVRYLVVPGIVIALGVGAWTHLRPKPTNTELPSSPES